MKVRLEANAQNIFNQGTVLSRTTQLNRANAISSSSLPIDSFFAGYDPKAFVTVGGSVPYNPIYGYPGGSYRNGGGPGTTLSSAFAATNPGFEAYQTGRVFRLGMRFQF